MFANSVFKNSQITKKKEYTVRDFQYRLSLIQKLLKDKNLDGFLLINGEYSENNKESINITNWLFKGDSGHLLHYHQFEDPEYEGSIFMVTMDGISAILEPQTTRLVQSKLVSTEKCQLFVPTAEEFKNRYPIITQQPHRETYQTLKVKQFFKMTHPLKNIGVVLSEEEGENIKKIENWPLIRSYALDGVGGGFFTMIHSVQNLRSDFKNQIFSKFDLFSKSHYLEIYSKQLVNNMNLTVQRISDTEQKRKQSEIFQDEYSKLFRETFEILEMSRGSPITMTLPFPSVLFGTHTSNSIVYETQQQDDEIYRKKIEMPKRKEMLPSSFNISQSSHIENKNAFHAVIENAEPMGMIRSARTYFFTSNAPKIQLFKPKENDMGYIDNYEMTLEKDPLFVDEYKLTSCYLKMLQTYLKFVRSLKSNLKLDTISKVKSAISKKVQNLNSKLTKEQSSSVKDEVVIQIKLYNPIGQEFDFYELSESLSSQNEILPLEDFLVVVRFTIKNISSVVDPSKSMGSIVVGDSFLFKGDYFLNLTRELRYFDFFECRAEYSQPIREMKEIYAQKLLGTRLAKQCGKLELYVPFIDQLDNSVIDFPVAEAEATWFEKSLKIDCDKYGCFILLNEDIVKVQFLGMLQYPWVIFQLKENIFFPKLNQPVICIKFSGQSAGDIYTDLKEHLESQEVSTENIDDYPEYMKSSLSLGQLKLEKIDQQNSYSGNQNQKNQEIQSYVHSTQLFSDIIINFQLQNILSIPSSSSSQQSPSKNDLQSLLKEDKNIKFDGAVEYDPKKVDFLVMVGPLGQSKRSLMETIDDMKDNFPMYGETIVQLIIYTEESMMEIDTDAFIQIIEDSIGEEEDQVSPGKGMILVVVPHTIDHLKVIRHIDASPQMRMRSVFTKIVLQDMYTANQQPIEQLGKYFMPGYTQYCFADVENFNPSYVFSRIDFLKECFPHVEFFKLEENSPSLNWVLKLVLSKRFDSERSQLLRSYYTSNFEFGYELIFFDYRIPLNFEKLGYLKEMILEQEGVLLNPLAKAEETTTAEEREARKQRINMDIKDLFAQEYKKLLTMIRGFKKLHSGNNSFMQIIRIKGLCRFEDQIDEGISSLYLSSYAEWLQDFEIPTEVKTVTKEGQDFVKPEYEDFSKDELGFYLYGKNLNRKDLIKWFNRNMLTVRFGYALLFSFIGGDIVEDQIELKRMRTRANLTLQEIDEQEKLNRNFGLSEAGLVFDGHFFRDGEGNYIDEHPNREEILLNFINSENEKFKEENSKLKSSEILRRKFYQNF